MVDPCVGVAGPHQERDISSQDRIFPCGPRGLNVSKKNFNRLEEALRKVASARAWRFNLASLPQPRPERARRGPAQRKTMNQAPVPVAARAYTPAQVTLHWLSVGLMALLALSGEIRHLLVGHTSIPMRSVMILHIGCGMALLVVTLARACVRMTRRRVAASGFCMQDACAHAVHLSIYAFILGECLLGWIIVNAKGFAIPLPLTDLEFPRLVAADPALVITAIWAHDVMAWMLYGLLMLHIGAALWHHYVSRDDTLARMRLRLRKQRLSQAAS